MGLFGFLGDVLGSSNQYHADPMQLQQHNYGDAINQAQAGALGSINAGAATGAQQALLAQQLAAQANGQGPSLAQMQLQQASDQNLKNQAGMIAGVKGINAAQAGRQVALAGANQGQNLANQAAQLRLNEQMQKQNLLANTLNAQRGADINQQGANTNLYGLTGQLQNQQNQTALQNYWNAQNINSGIAAQNTDTGNKIGGGLIQGGASIGAAMAGAAHGAVIKDGMAKVAVSPGEKVVSPEGDISSVPGEAHYEGDDPRNDTVIADLREDSIVVPRSKSNDKEKMIGFIKHMKESSKKKSDLQQVLESHQELKQKLEELNYKMGKWMPK